jgi:hypothetical protein
VPDLPERVVGLYSFPKSGNTWLRAIIAGLTGMPTGPGALHKYVTDSHYGPVTEHGWDFQGVRWYFYKSHFKALMTEDHGAPLQTDRVIHIRRHPLDVFLSYLNFVSKNVSPTAGRGLPFEFDRVEDLSAAEMEALFEIFLQHGTLIPANRAFGTVFEHAAAFRALARETGKVHMLRYEDLLDDFAAAVASICDFLGFRGVDLDAAYRLADRRTQQDGRFFWRRRKETFRDFLTEGQIARFHQRWHDQMVELGYPQA